MVPHCLAELDCIEGSRIFLITREVGNLRNFIIGYCEGRCYHRDIDETDSLARELSTKIAESELSIEGWEKLGVPNWRYFRDLDEPRE